MAEYLAIDDERSNREAIGLLHSWANARDPDRRLVGELAFLYAAGDLVERRTGGAAQEGTVLEGTVLEDMVQEDMVQEEEVWPALLATAARDPLRQEELAALWQGALCSPDVYEAAHTVLGQWASMAESVPAARRALGRLLALAAGSDRSTRIIRYLAAQWALADGAAHAPETSQVVIAYLEGRTNGR
jgi:hypothetical protein